MAELGILGAGQLALMLRDAAVHGGVEPRILAHHPEEPALKNYAKGTVVAHNDDRALATFIHACDNIIFESEFWDCKRLRRLAAPRTRFFPSLAAIEILQDKWQQKVLLQQLGIPAPDLLGTVAASDLPALEQRCGFLPVLKWARNGYDGKGTFLPGGRTLVDAAAFVNNAQTQKITVYAERPIDFAEELAMVAVRGDDGSFSHFPLTISRQEKGICRDVCGPASAFGVHLDFEHVAAAAMRKLADHLQLVGVFAFEFFLTKTGDLLVNEIAPRVHNTGHYTQNACRQSQFAAHCRSVLGETTKVELTAPFFGMGNVLGPRQGSPRPAEPFGGSPFSGVFVHDYGKREVRPGRKMGHINFVGHSQAEFDLRQKQARELRAQWEESFLKEA